MNNDISIEEFDKPCEKHEFSTDYMKKKRNLIKAYRKELQPKRSRGHFVAIAAATLALIIATPFVYYAASGGGIVSHIWPRTEKSKAEEIEQNVNYTPITRTFDDGNVLTIVGVLSDGKGAVVEYTLANPDGVKNFFWSNETNQDHGGWFTENSTYNFSIIGEGKTYTDPERSTSDCLYNYAYIIFIDGVTKKDSLDLVIDFFPCTMGEWHDPSKDDMKLKSEMVMQQERISIPIQKELTNVSSKDVNGIKYDISSFSICPYGFWDPWDIISIMVTLKDGTSFDACATANYICGRSDGGIVYYFDRIINTDEVSSVQITSRKAPEEGATYDADIMESEAG